MSRSPRKARGWFINAGKVILALGLVALVISMNWSKIQEVRGRPHDLRLFAVGFGLYFLGVLLAFVRWYTLVRALGMPFQLRDAMRLGFIGNFFNLVIPGAIGGDVVKAAYLRREQSKKTHAIVSVVVDRVVGLLGLFLLAGIAGVLSWRRLDPEVHRLVVIVWCAIGTGFALLAVGFSPSLFRPLAHRFAGRKRLHRLLAELSLMGTAYRDRIGVVILGVVLGMVTHSLNVLAFYAVSRSLFPIVPTVAEHFLMVPLVLFTTAVPLPFGALGVTEGISSQLFKLLADYDGGAIAMMGFRVLQYACASISATVYLANRSRVRELTEEDGYFTTSPRPISPKRVVSSRSDR